jgi:hypothetical protein
LSLTIHSPCIAYGGSGSGSIWSLIIYPTPLFLGYAINTVLLSVCFCEQVKMLLFLSKMFGLMTQSYPPRTHTDLLMGKDIRDVSVHLIPYFIADNLSGPLRSCVTMSTLCSQNCSRTSPKMKLQEHPESSARCTLLPSDTATPVDDKRRFS